MAKKVKEHKEIAENTTSEVVKAASKVVKNKSGHKLDFCGIIIEIGGEYTLTKDDEQNETIMLKLNHAKTLNMIDLV